MSNNSPARGFFRNAFDAVIAARQRQADHYVVRMDRMHGYGFFGADNARQRKSD